MRISSAIFTWDYWMPMVFNLLRMASILIFAYIASVLLQRLVQGARSYAIRMMERSGGSNIEIEKRAKTIGGVVRKVLTLLVWSLALLMLLKEMNFDVRPLLAGAGVVGVAVGLGAQSLIKDCLAGFFLLIENQMRINDVVIISGVGGLVEEINLRTTVLRSDDGAVHVVPNGSIQNLSNLTREYSYYLFSISLAYKNDTDEVVRILKELGAALREDEPYKSATLAPLEIMGVDQLTDSGVIIKARIKTLPIQQWLVGRELLRRIKIRFGQAGICTPSSGPTVQIVQPISPDLRTELKSIVREVLAEQRA